jgi:hypothetical protein
MVLSHLAPLAERGRGLLWSHNLHNAHGDAGVMEEVTASAGCRNVLVVTGSAAEEVAEFMCAAEMGMKGALVHVWTAPRMQEEK